MKKLMKSAAVLFFLVLFTTALSASALANVSKTSNTLLWPVDPNAAQYRIGGLDYYSSGGSHPGGKSIDIYGTSVYAIESGTIRFKSNTCSHVSREHTTCNHGMGNYIAIQHDNGLWSRYLHLKQNSLTSKKVGERVGRGEKIADVGSSGNSTGAHLHFDLYTKYSAKAAERVQVNAFDYYKDKADIQPKFAFRTNLQTHSRLYGAWIRANYTKSATISSRSYRVAEMYTVTFSGGLSVSPTSKTVMKGGVYGELPTPVLPFNEFTGWFTSATGGTEITSSTKVNLSANQTLYAQWKANLFPGSNTGQDTAACKHPSYDSSGYCSVATCRAEFPINITTMSSTFYAVRDDVPVRARPYAPESVLQNLKKDEAVSVVGRGTNSAGNLWYVLNNGRWVFSDHLTSNAPSNQQSTPQQPNQPPNTTADVYPRYTGSSNSIVDALNSINVNSSFDFRARIAAANGIANYSGTSAQNTQMLNLLKAGNLKRPSNTQAPNTQTPNTQTPGIQTPVTPPQTSTSNYPRYTGSSNSIADALRSLGIDSSYNHRARIAAANGISNYSGTAAQNTQMLNMLKAGNLKRP